MKIVYVSPLKALSYDIERNLRAPLQGIKAPISVGLRTGDTPQSERRKMRREPPDILITTPESLYLMISSQAREILTGVEAVIVDEIHAVAPSKRGSHLALTLERLDHLGKEDEPIQRIGLSATQRPLERIGQFLVGSAQECEIVDASEPKELDLEIVVPVEDMVELDADTSKRRDGGRHRQDAPPGQEQGPEALTGADRPRPDRGLARPGDQHPLDLAGDLPATARADQGAQLDHPLRQRPPRCGADREAAERDATSTSSRGAAGDRARREREARPGTRRRPRSPAPTMARSPTRSGRSSRSCSSRASFPAWSRPRRWSSGSTWARWTW